MKKAKLVKPDAVVVVSQNHRNRIFKDKFCAEVWCQNLSKDEQKHLGLTHIYTANYDCTGELILNESSCYGAF